MPPKRPHRVRRRFGQHFLHERGVLEKIIQAVAPTKDDFMVEIGPGEGALTHPLLERVAKLHVIELDRDLAAALKRDDKIVVHQADALDFDFGQFPRGMRLVGNLPYNISTPLLFHLARYADRVRDMHFMLQLEVVERMVASPSTADYGRLSVALQVRFRMKKLFNVSKGAFRPPPKVESAVVRMEPLADPPALEGTRFDDLLRGAFSSRRKQLRNALPLAAADFPKLGIDPSARPENLSPADYVRIAQYLRS
ncbi:MAG TPA: 16S rRNA (adenine(1518)-N(6)/adenine(1519)-N(6))-dimethyltransferase RsmA [Burkholderiales bacterium]|nr:16S rRNA (adenine(1518)-N(6)/adenine(1519)-N(6))-dimethyltransferase RsmA [Burkholderiales bacterium]